MSPRPDITLTANEQTALLREVQKASLATVDPDGFPHVVAMGFLGKDGAIFMTSYAKAQKVLNARRNPKVGVMIETGQQYTEFRGLMIRGRCDIIEDPGVVETIVREIATKQGRTVAAPSRAITSAPKRVVLKITPEKIASWDHTKLGGRY
jgi:nitroimidazol reductase NimA-like FMN-containing flavoprotein (pyridoxamine 5'-phosphate oxidase superfamily)